jgi:hypothetical protein
VERVVVRVEAAVLEEEEDSTRSPRAIATWRCLFGILYVILSVKAMTAFLTGVLLSRLEKIYGFTLFPLSRAEVRAGGAMLPAIRAFGFTSHPP